VCLYCFCDYLSFSDLIYAANVLNVYNNERRTVTASCISKTSTYVAMVMLPVDWSARPCKSCPCHVRWMDVIETIT
jgi:hypothetical protein